MGDRLDAMLEDVRAFVRERDWEQFHDPKNLAMAVVSEAGRARRGSSAGCRATRPTPTAPIRTTANASRRRRRTCSSRS